MFTMCPPPLVCPLCASAGGFTSPGALWLGLIGVANRLLSCPVCHELLLGLDKLTIHLVSHVPNLNLLASSIGNHVNINQNSNDESLMAQTDGVKDHSSSFSVRNVSSTRKKQSNSRMNAKIKELVSSQSSSSQSSNFMENPRSNNKDLVNLEDTFFNQEIAMDRHCPNQVHCNVSPRTIALQLGTNKTVEELEVVPQDRKEETASEGTNFKTIHENSTDKASLEISSGQLARTLSGKDIVELSSSNILHRLPEKKGNYIMEFKNDSYCPTQSFPAPSKKSISVAATVHGQASSVTTEKRNGWVNYNNAYFEITEDAKSQNTSHGDNISIKTRCGSCSMIFDDPKYLQLHCIMVHPSVDLLYSSFGKTTSQSPLNFPCELCNRKLSSNSDLVVHMRYAHSTVPENSADDNLERKHFAVESNDKFEKLIISTNQESHIQSTASELQSKTNRTKEDQIIKITEKPQEETFPRKNDQQENIVYDDRPNSSNDGLRTTDNENSQDTNKEDCSNGSPAQQYAVDDEIKHSCKVCNAQFGSIAELIAHRPAHIEENGCICVVCGKSFKKEQHLQQHLRTHEGKQWECDVCCKFFTTKYFLKKHKRLHTGEMPYCCEACGKTFTFQQSYHKHLLYHSDEKPHSCGECGKRFKELSTLHNHERIHTGEKPFTCESCGKAFRQRVSYLVHRRIHTGVMPYKCTACEKSFRYKVSQRTHKCSSQQTGTVVRQSSDLVERLLSHQKDKSTTEDCPDGKNEVTFTHSINEQSLNRNQNDEKLPIMTEFSPTTVMSDHKIDSFNLDSNSLHSASVISDSQNANSSFIDGISGGLTSNQCPQGKTLCNFDSAITCELEGMQENTFNFRQAIEKGGIEEKHSGSCPADLGNRTTNTIVTELTSRGNSECGSNFVFTCESECKHQHIQVLHSKNIENKGVAIQGNDNAIGEDFGSPMFSSASHMLTHSEPEFFTLVMPPADPALEKLGKLSISSMHSPEKSNSGSNFPENHYHDIPFTQKTDSSTKEVITSPQGSEKGFEDHNASSKSSLIDIDNTDLSRDQDGTANAADLSSFLQSCLEQWHPSNFIASEKEREGISSQETPQPTVDKKYHCPIDGEDNRLHTINEESLRRLLYGDNVP